jgi:hypothetical protein
MKNKANDLYKEIKRQGGLSSKTAKAGQPIKGGKAPKSGKSKGYFR